MRHKSQQEKPSLTTPHLPIPPLLEIPPLSLRTTKSDFYIWSQNLGSCPVGLFLFLFFLVFFFFFFFFLKQFSKVLKGKSEFLWILLVPAFRFFKTLTGLRRGFFSITVLSPARCGKITTRNGNYIRKPLDF